MGDLEHRALGAARAIAVEHGLSPDDAEVVHSGSNVLVHLRPAAVVARVMTGTVALHDDPSTWLAREVSVLEFLAPSGLAVAPSPLIVPGPFHHDGLWMTFAEWIPDAAPTTDPGDSRQIGRTLRDLHAALLPFDGDLGDMGDLRQNIERLHGHLRPTGATERLRARLNALGDDVFGSALPAQALHGDVSLSNLLRTSQGPIFNDFEDTLRGPVHWDVAGFVISLETRGASRGFVGGMLDAYGFDDERTLAPFRAAHEVYDEIWRRFDAERRLPVRRR